ncbi:MAG: CsgG/HfaB family protein [Desulforhopalus sp.]|nr:CsgG/HfaB family protein [Desulforhopalus sp.]
MISLRQTVRSRLVLLFACSALLLFAGCVGQTGTNVSQTQVAQPPKPELAASKVQKRPERQGSLGTIAVAKVAIDHPSGRLVYQPNGVSDTIVRQMQATGNYKVIDWTNLQEVLFRRNLEWSDLQSDKNLGRKVHEVLLNDYFLMGTITSYGERMDYASTAFSKAKTQIVNVTLELAVKDALTNEIVASAQGKGEKSRQITQTLGFGAAGGNDMVLANAVLDMAIEDAVAKIDASLASLPAKPGGAGRQASDVAQAIPVAVKPLPGNPKVLFIFSEAEDSPKPKTAGGKSSELGTSLAEHAMAKSFAAAKAQVLTADDVINKAYSISGGQNIIQGGWVTEKDLREVENLLQARTGLSSYAVQVGKSAKADMVISGSVRYQTAAVAGPAGMAAQQSTVYLTAKAIAVASGKTLHMATSQQDFLAIQSPSEMKARMNALTLAAQKAAEELLTVMRGN